MKNTLLKISIIPSALIAIFFFSMVVTRGLGGDPFIDLKEIVFLGHSWFSIFFVPLCFFLLLIIFFCENTSRWEKKLASGVMLLFLYSVLIGAIFSLQVVTLVGGLLSLGIFTIFLVKWGFTQLFIN